MLVMRDPVKAPAEIARLTKLNEEATERVAKYMKDSASYQQVRAARMGVRMREELIEELKKLV